jgi:hypothetical protein
VKIECGFAELLGILCAVNDYNIQIMASSARYGANNFVVVFYLNAFQAVIRL